MNDFGEGELPRTSTKERGIAKVEGFPLPVISTSLGRAIELNGLTVDEFCKRQEVWADATGQLFDLIDEKSEQLHLTDNPLGFKERDLEGYFDAFSKWREEVGKYGGTIDAQTILSDGTNPEEVTRFLKELARAAISENII